jgi:tetraacyldisaccharide 4'-kinase
MDSRRKVIITTEKDAMRLQLHQKFIVDNLLPIFAIPVMVKFHGTDGKQFDESVKDFLLEYKS